MLTSDLLIKVAGIVLPVFLIVAVGWAYGRKHQPDMIAANRMNLEVFIPALVFGTLAEGHFEIREQWIPAVAMAGMVLGSGLLSWPIARLLKISPLTFVPPMMFNNCGNLGIPLAILAFGSKVLPVAMTLFLTSNLIHFSLGAYLLNREQNLLTLWKVPVISALIVGLVFATLKITLWPPLLTAFRLLGDIAAPLMLFALGVKVAEAPIHHLRIGLVGGVLRPVLGIALMLLAIEVFSIPKETAGLLILYGSLPPAVINYMFADRYKQEPSKVASIVLAGNLMSVAIMPLVLAAIFSL